MAMLIKVGVDISRLNRGIRRSLPLVNHFMIIKAKELVIISTYEGDHGKGSLAYANDAYHFRWTLKKSDFADLKLDLEISFPKQFKLTLEDDYVCIEYDPR